MEPENVSIFQIFVRDDKLVVLQKQARATG